MDLVKTLNFIRQNASSFYQERIPVATQTNLEKLSNAMATYPQTQNEFLTLLINKIGLTIVNSKMIENPLAQLKTGKVPMGKNIEELFVNPAIAKEYQLTSQDMLKVTPPDVKALYYSLNRQDKYPVTIAEPTLLQALTSPNKMQSLIQNIVNSLYSGDNLDEFLLMKELIKQAVTQDNVIKKELPFTPEEMTKDNAHEFLKILRGDTQILQFPSSSYNSYKKVKPETDTGRDVITFTPIKDQVLILDSKVYANVSVDALASAFNLTYANFEPDKIITVDNFNGAPIIALLCDRAWFRIYDNLPVTIRDMQNGDTLNHHYWLHHWQTIAYSMFANAIAYTYVEPTV